MRRAWKALSFSVLFVACLPAPPDRDVTPRDDDTADAGPDDDDPTDAGPDDDEPDPPLPPAPVLDVVFTRGWLRVYARDMNKSSTCTQGLFPDVGVCAEWSDVSCETPGPQPDCLDRLAIRIERTGEVVEVGPESLPALGAWGVDFAADELTLIIEGCGGAAEAPLPRAQAEPPTFSVAGDAIELAVPCQLIEDSGGNFAGELCGHAPTTTVSLAQPATWVRTVAVVTPLGTVETSVAPVRVFQMFGAVSRTAELVPRDDGGFDLPLRGVQVYSNTYTWLPPKVGDAHVEPDGTLFFGLTYDEEGLGPHTVRIWLGADDGDRMERDVDEGTIVYTSAPRWRGHTFDRFDGFGIAWLDEAAVLMPGDVEPSSQLVQVEIETGIALSHPAP